MAFSFGVPPQDFKGPHLATAGERHLPVTTATAVSRWRWWECAERYCGRRRDLLMPKRAKGVSLLNLLLLNKVFIK